MTTLRCLFLSIVVMLCLSTTHAQIAMAQSAGLTYTQIDVPGSFGTIVTGINNDGVVVGSYDYSGGEWRSFTWKDGVFTYFHIPNALSTIALSINDAGVIVGYYLPPDGKTVQDGFIYDGRTFTFVHYPNAAITWLTAINNAGVVVGFQGLTPGGARGFEWVDGEFHSLLSGSFVTTPHGLNNLGDITGGLDPAPYVYLSFVYSGGRYTILSYPEASETGVGGINDNRVIVGTHDTDLWVSCFYWKGGNFQDYSILRSNGTYCEGINNAGVIVGYYYVPYTFHGFVTSPIQ